MSIAQALLWSTVALNLAWLVLCLIGLAADSRRLHGENVWAKPARFAPSLALHYATMALAVGLLSPEWRDGALVGWAAAIGAGACLFQTLFIGIMAARGLPSHHNEATPLLRICSYAMALCAILVTWSPVAAGLAALLDEGFAGTPALRWGLFAGLAAGAAMTTWTAFHMGLIRSPYPAGRPVGGRRLPILGWSREVGDLRPIHFLATHAMQTVPLAALALGALVPERALALTLLAALLYVAATLALYRAAVAGRPVTRPFAPARAGTA